jgi:hypothetical protein
MLKNNKIVRKMIYLKEKDKGEIVQYLCFLSFFFAGLVGQKKKDVGLMVFLSLTSISLICQLEKWTISLILSLVCIFYFILYFNYLKQNDLLIF